MSITETLFALSQIFIVIFGASAIFLVGRKDKYQKYGYLLGLLSQPFWFYATIYSQQWGMFLLNFFYLYSWLNGFKNYWLKK